MDAELASHVITADRFKAMGLTVHGCRHAHAVIHNPDRAARPAPFAINSLEHDIGIRTGRRLGIRVQRTAGTGGPEGIARAHIHNGESRPPRQKIIRFAPAGLDDRYAAAVIISLQVQLALGDRIQQRINRSQGVVTCNAIGIQPRRFLEGLDSRLYRAIIYAVNCARIESLDVERGLQILHLAARTPHLQCGIDVQILSQHIVGAGRNILRRRAFLYIFSADITRSAIVGNLIPAVCAAQDFHKLAAIELTQNIVVGSRAAAHIQRRGYDITLCMLSCVRLAGLCAAILDDIGARYIAGPAFIADRIPAIGRAGHRHLIPVAQLARHCIARARALAHVQAPRYLHNP